MHRPPYNSPAFDSEPDEAPEKVPHWARERMVRQLDRLDRLGEIGMDIAEALARQIQSTDDAAPLCADPALAFDRVARAVRLTVALQSLLIAQIDARDDGREIAGPDRGRAASNDNHDKAAREPLVIRWMDDDEDLDDRGNIVERAVAEYDRPDQDRYADLLKLPFDEIVARICQDLGLDPGETCARMEAGAEPPFPPPSSQGLSLGPGNEDLNIRPAPA